MSPSRFSLVLLFVACFVRVVRDRDELSHSIHTLWWNDCAEIGDWRRPDFFDTFPVKPWCSPTSPVAQGRRADVLDRLFADILKIKGSNDAATALDVGVYRSVAVVGSDKLINPFVVQSSKDFVNCNTAVGVVARARIVHVRSDHERLRTPANLPVRVTTNYTGSWSCVVHDVIDELRRVA